jgi:WD40 repeat protein
MNSTELQVTDRPTGHILTNTNVWSPDGKWIVYDTRSDPAGEKFDGDTIEIVNVDTREVREIYRSRRGAHCGVATFSPKENRVVFIGGPENPTADWQYNAWHRQGLVVDLDNENAAAPLDARDIAPPFTPGALRGGTHVHVFDPDGEWVAFTYEDHVLALLDAAAKSAAHDANQRNVGVSVPIGPTRVKHDHPRNHDGNTFSVVVTRTVNSPRRGSDEISRAFEDSWVGSHGYVRADGTRQRRAIAFQGQVVDENGKSLSEVFIVDIPDDITLAGDAPLAGTSTTRPAPPRGVRQRRLTHTADRKFPGLQGPRHWLRSSPDGSRIACLMRDDQGIVQIWTISPNGGEPQQLTHNAFDVASAFNWSPDGRRIAFIADNSVFVCDAASGASTRLTERTDDSHAPRPEACVFSPDGRRIAYIRPVSNAGGTHNQVFVVDCLTQRDE